ncbi:hypothetical protein HDU78_007629 [Chytriomyces hyalinus]|nr:hypothetical protein HDU78_007629 [Chytriomyces hyalinus]
MSRVKKSQQKVDALQNQVSEVQDMLNSQISDLAQRGENLEKLQSKTEGLEQSALMFKKGASDVRKAMWWKDMKMKLILGAILSAILIVIIMKAGKTSAVRNAEHEGGNPNGFSGTNYHLTTGS